MKIKSLILFLFFILAFIDISLSQNKLAKKADKTFEKHEYFSAIELYKEAYNSLKGDVPEKARILFQLAECYRFTDNYNQCINWYTRVIKANYPNPIATLHLAEAYRADEQYEEAIVIYKDYEKLVPKDPRGKCGMESCEFSIKCKEYPTKYVCENISFLNSKYYDFAPCWCDKKKNFILFSSTRNESTGTDLDGKTGHKFSDIYIASISTNSSYNEPLPFDENINTALSESAPCLNNTSTTIYYTKCYFDKKENFNCKIFYSKKMGKFWATPDTLNIPNTNNIDLFYPYVDDNELTIYFSADMPGGYGGMDIWVAHRDNKNQNFGNPVNCGNIINKSGDEIYPRLYNNEVMYFSSNSPEHYGLGCFDIFKSIKINDNWSPPVNLKYPLNSSLDDFGIIFLNDTTEGLLTSMRKGGSGYTDIYHFFLSPLFCTLEGIVRDDETNQVISNASVTLRDTAGNEIVTFSDDNGFYKFNQSQITPNNRYKIIVNKPKYYVTEGSEQTYGLKNSIQLVHDFTLLRYKTSNDNIKLSSNTSIIPLIKQNNLYYLKVILNDNEKMKFDFLLDTGADNVLVSSDIFSVFYKAGLIHDSDILNLEYFSIADGSVVIGLKFILKKVQIGNLVLPNVEASVIKGSNSCLLGGSLLNRFGRYTIDVDNLQLIIEK